MPLQECDTTAQKSTELPPATESFESLVPIFLSKLVLMSFTEAITRWRALPEEERLRRRWNAIPSQVADSMAFEGEPVDLAWLKTLHQTVVPPVGSKQPKAHRSLVS